MGVVAREGESGAVEGMGVGIAVMEGGCKSGCLGFVRSGGRQVSRIYIHSLGGAEQKKVEREISQPAN